MLGLPWAAVTFVRGSSGMAVCLLLFFAIDPLFAILCGTAAGKQEELWMLPMFPALLFAVGAWLFLEPGESAFLLYAFVYLLLGYAAMFAARFGAKRKY